MERFLGLRLTLCILLFSFLGACGFYKEKSLKDPFIIPAGGTVKISYQAIRQGVFLPNCVACHGNSGGVNLESYSAIKANLSKVEKAVLIDKTMPKGRPLGALELKLLDLWIKAGAPENSDTPTPNLPLEPNEPIDPSFTSIKKRIFDSKCLSCHTEGGGASGVPLRTIQDLLTSPRELVLPGNPDESGLWIAVSRQDNKKMPPPTSGSPLSSEELAIIKKWIEIGAPETKGGLPSGATPGDGADVPIDVSKLHYPLVREKVFVPRCVSCHGNSGGVRLDSYPSIKDNLGRIAIVTLVEKSMPKNGSLTKAESRLLSAWIKVGAPEGIESGPTPLPSSSPVPQEPLISTFSSIKKRVFDVRCISCHSGPTPKGDLSLESLKDLLKSGREPLKMEDEGDPSSSGLGIAISRQDEKRMPPPSTGVPLSQMEIEVIKKWIKDGARE